MNIRTKVGVGVAAGAVVLAAAGVGVAQATGGDNDQVSGPAADQARVAATQAVPGGTAGEVDQETGEGNVVYGVAVTKPDGTAVEVHLDANFHVVDTQPAGHDRDTDNG
jgi:hypothetical protein